jgi:predicted ester cyclase
MKRSPPFLLAAAFLALSLLPTLVLAQVKGVPMSLASTDHAVVIHRFYEQCLDQHQSVLIPELFTPNVILHSPNGDSTGLAAISQTVERVHAMFPSHHFIVDDVVASGDKAAARWTMTAINTAPIAGVAPTGRPITQKAIVFYRFEDGKIAEFWLQLDQVGVFRQIGVALPGVPTPSSQSPTASRAQ